MQRWIAACAALFAANCAHAQEALLPPDWMAGHWLSCADGEVSETWVGEGSGLLVGSNVTRGAQASFEWLRVSEGSAGGLSYWSSPNGRSPPSEFPMVSHDRRRVVFENAAHDFPQRIIYVREGDVMIARIEGNMDGRFEGMEWRFARAALGARCPAP